MIRKIVVTSLLLAPLLTFAQGNGQNGNGNGHAYGHRNRLHAPEIDGSNVVLAVALLGGILSLARRRDKRSSRPDTL
ncbi:hypothetical protein [Noviherbaspirillum sedimenti]|uniref:hypothetical protein n=1 Tax=Noviherbaspirillum sedimenti TaxID=2320865 RepID=UPI0011C42F70|nr:hypothetical protein [Noviherbaspirillum sedimenti]